MRIESKDMAEVSGQGLVQNCIWERRREFSAQDLDISRQISSIKYSLTYIFSAIYIQSLTLLSIKHGKYCKYGTPSEQQQHHPVLL